MVKVICHVYDAQPVEIELSRVPHVGEYIIHGDQAFYVEGVIHQATVSTQRFSAAVLTSIAREISEFTPIQQLFET